MPGNRDDIFDPIALTKLNRKADLINRLNLLHKRLGEVSQDPADRPASLEALSTYLISKKILNHVDKDVRLLACCCLVDILRIYAPDAPFNDSEMVMVFDVMVSQIRSLSTYNSQSATGSKVVYILSSLSTVKSCVVPVILAQSGVPGAEEVVTSLFDALISSFRPEHGEEVLGHMCAVMQACIEESDDMDQDVLDLLLAPLLPLARTENPTAYKMVAAVLRRVGGAVEQAVSRFVNYVLVGSAAPEKGKNSELADHVYALIYELHKISPGLLLRILPNVCEQLLAEEEDIRLNAVKLLGQLFSSPHADYGVEYKKNFRDFLGRFQDVSPTIRLEMVDCGSLIMKKKPELKAQIEEFLSKRLRDSEAEIRLRAVTRLIEVGSESPLNLSAATFEEIGQRAKDRRPEVRKLVVTTLAKLYHTHVSSKLPPIGDLLQNESEDLTGQEDGVTIARGMFADRLRQGVLERLSFVPSIIINAWGYPELTTRHLLLQLLQEYVLPKSVSERDLTETDSSDQSVTSGSSQPTQSKAKGKSAAAEIRASSLSVARSKAVSAEVEEALDSQRASALLLLYTLLEKNDRESLGTILGYKTKVRNDVSAFLDARTQLLAADAESAEHTSGGIQLKRAMLKLVQTLPTPDKKTQLLEKLNAVKDKTVFRLLARVTDAKDGVLKSCDYREDLKQRLDSKSPLGEYIGLLFDSAAFMVAHQGVVSALVSFASEIPANTPAGANASALLALLAKHSALSYTGASESVGKWVSHCVEAYDAAVAEAVAAEKDLNQGKSRSAAKREALEYALSVRMTTFNMVNQSMVVVNYAAGALAEDEIDSENSLCRALVNISMRHTDTAMCEKLGEAAARLALLTETHQHRTGRASQAGRASTASAASSSAASKPPIIAAIQLLASSKRLSLSNKRLANDLFTLAAFVRIPLTTSITTDFIGRYGTSDIHVAASAAKEKVLDFILREMVHSEYSALAGSLRAAVNVPASTAAASSSSPKKKSKKGTSAAAAKQRGDSRASASEEEQEEEEGNEETKEDSQIDEDAVGKTLSAGLTAWTAFVMSHAEVDQRRSSRYSLGSSSLEDMTQDDDRGGLSEEVSELCDALFDCIRTKGTKFGTAKIDSAEESEIVFESAALCALNLIKLRSIGQFLSVDRWHQLGWTLLHPSEGVRMKLLSKLGQVIQTTVVHPRFLAYPCLLATDDALAYKSEQSLMFAVRRLRSTHEALCGRALAEDSDYLRVLAQNNMPEMVLPYVLHLLSYHPDFPQSANAQDPEDRARVKGIVRNVKMVLNVLMGSLKDGLGNLSFLLKQVNMILQNYEDKIDNDNLGVHWVSQLTLKLLKEQIKTADNVLPYPGDIRLPDELFRQRKKSASDAFDGREVAEAIKGLEGAEEAIDQAIHGRGAGGPLLGKGRARMGREGQAARQQVKEQAEEGDNGDDDDESPKKRKPTAAAKATKKQRPSPKSEPAPAPVRVSSRPQRNASRAVSSYAEPDENDREADAWDRAAIEAKRRSSSPSKGVNSASKEPGVKMAPIFSISRRVTANVGGRSPDDQRESSQEDTPKMKTVTVTEVTSSPSPSSRGVSTASQPQSEEKVEEEEEEEEVEASEETKNPRRRSANARDSSVSVEDHRVDKVVSAPTGRRRGKRPLSLQEKDEEVEEQEQEKESPKRRKMADLDKNVATIASGRGGSKVANVAGVSKDTKATKGKATGARTPAVEPVAKGIDENISPAVPIAAAARSRSSVRNNAEEKKAKGPVAAAAAVASAQGASKRIARPIRA